MTGNDLDAKSGQPEKEKTEPLTVLDAMSLAQHFHREGNLEYAKQIYEQLLAQFPNFPDALHYLGVLQFQCGKVEEGEKLVLASLDQVPEYVDALNSLGNIYREKGDSAAAERVYRRICEINPNFPHAHLNLATLYYEMNNYEQAIIESRKAGELSPEMYESYLIEGNSHRELNQNDEAAISFSKAAKHEKWFKASHFDNLTRAFIGLGREAEAIDAYRKWVEVDPDNPKPRHHLAGLTGIDIPPRASDAYLKVIFDQFAASFDQNLSKIKYAVPDRIAHFVKTKFGEPRAEWEVLDAGCGTGLGAAGVRPYARHFTGVDISTKMLEKARARNLYDDLKESELTKYLVDHPQAFDLIVSSDTLIYFGELADVLVAMFEALRPRGRLIFSVEKCQDDDSPHGYVLHPHGRYAHSEKYLRELLNRAGFPSCSFEELVIRMERGQPQAGLLVFCQRND